MYRKDVNSFELPVPEYKGTMNSIRNQVHLSDSMPNWSPDYAQGLIDRLNPNINPGSNQRLIGGLESIIDSHR